MNTNLIFDQKKNITALTLFIAVFLIISSLFGVTWFFLGDFTYNAVNYYHVIMIPFALLLIIISAFIVKLPNIFQKAINSVTYPVIIFTVLGLAFFYYPSLTIADEYMQAIRDFIMLIIGLVFIVGLIYYPFKDKYNFKTIWGAYSFLAIAAIAAEIAAVYGLITAAGTFIGFSKIPILQSYINSLNETDSTFMGNIVTSHSHAMLPAVMGGIVALTALAFNYEKLPSRCRSIVNWAFVISIFGTLSMSYLYWISGLGTYVIPTIAPFGPGGMDGLALDDSQTGIVGWGALIAIAGLWYTATRNGKLDKLRIAEFATWIFTMIAMIGIGYVIEFNEAFYGFATPGVPPNGGPGYLYDMAFINGHLLYAFFLMPVLALVIVAADLMIPEENAGTRNLIGYLAISGMVIGVAGLQLYTMTLHWQVEALGLYLIVISILLMGVFLAMSFRGIVMSKRSESKSKVSTGN
ncbi:TVG1190485 [Thermoplasma volcanium GSS1]|uniref:TVG1190485 protein n=1 Tax=Thermoplasma volcanium (strain ATCC 51530 / DSM 4299 / JCM 9571 / NBRC 15438 / GSS1) TaxID=273116 RepID=Q979J8_THEVO|nr:hypothetical protein [Thermoplasma volcanium]BAB60305.1 TVG1190485 [Thermoplasma volcanium GSS1]